VIKSTKHFLKETNQGKISDLTLLVKEYRRVAKVILEDVWYNSYSWITEKDGVIENHTFNVSQNKLEHPKFLNYKDFNLETKLSARMLSSLVTQLCGILGASVEKQRKRLYIREKIAAEGGKTTLLDRKILQNIPVLPNLDNVNMELSSKCAEFIKTEGHFGGFVKLKSLGFCEAICLPIKFHKMNKKYESWEMKGSFLISDKVVNLRFFKEDPELRTEGSIIGGDQGLKTCLTLSDDQITKSQPTPNPNVSHDLESIIRKMCRKKKGSRAFKKLQDQRKNYIHWSLNQLNLEGVKEVRFEKIWNIGFRKSRSKLLSHWTNTIIRDGFEDICNQNGVRFVEVESAYKSQRCWSCGLVKKSSRKGKLFKCSCGHVMDADSNSSKNQPLNLPPITFEFRKLKLNVKGFYWLETGIFDLNGVEIRVPLDPSIK
jgi:hypothetical protein